MAWNRPAGNQQPGDVDAEGLGERDQFEIAD